MLKNRNFESKDGGYGGQVDGVYFPVNLNHEDGVDDMVGGRNACHTTLLTACSKYVSLHGIRHLLYGPVPIQQT